MTEFWTIAGAVFVAVLGILVVQWLYRRWQNRRMWQLLVELYPGTASWLYWGAVAAKRRGRR